MLAEVRKAKSQGEGLARLARGPGRRGDTPERLAALDAARRGLSDAGKIAKLDVEVGAAFSVAVELAEPAA